jgi:integrase
LLVKPLEPATTRKPAPNRVLVHDEAVKLITTSQVSLDADLEKFNLSPRVRNSCAQEGIRTVGDLAGLTPAEIMSWRNTGQKALTEIRLLLCSLGLQLSDDPEPHHGHPGSLRPRPLRPSSTTPKKKIVAERPVWKRQPWNKGVEVGQRDAFTPAEVKRIRRLLADRGVSGLRDLALFSTAIDTMLSAWEVLNLAVRDVTYRDGTIRDVIEVARSGRSHRCVLSKVTADALHKWITASGKQRSDYLFPGRRGPQEPMSARQTSRLLKDWVADAGLDPRKYGTESLRRTKALHILNRTGDLDAVRVLLGHAKIESTANYLRISRKLDPIAICRAFEI